MEIMQNPYHFTTKITERKLFFNRSKSIDKITRFLSGYQMQNVAIVGDRKIGKSSLLYYLAYYHPKLEGLKRIYFDLESVANADEFFQQIDFDRLRDNDEKCVLFLDEIENSANFENCERFFKKLRAFGDSPNSALVVASREAMINFVPQFKWSSPLYNIFAPHYMKPFTEENSKDLIQNLPNQIGLELTEEQRFSPQEINVILKLSECHPWKIQLYCYYFFETKVNDIFEEEELEMEIEKAISHQTGDNKEFFPTKIDWKELAKADVSQPVKSLLNFMVKVGEKKLVG